MTIHTHSQLVDLSEPTNPGNVLWHETVKGFEMLSEFIPNDIARDVKVLSFFMQPSDLGEGYFKLTWRLEKKGR